MLRLARIGDQTGGLFFRYQRTRSAYNCDHSAIILRHGSASKRIYGASCDMSKRYETVEVGRPSFVPLGSTKSQKRGEYARHASFFSTPDYLRGKRIPIVNVTLTRHKYASEEPNGAERAVGEETG